MKNITIKNKGIKTITIGKKDLGKTILIDTNDGDVLIKFAPYLRLIDASPMDENVLIKFTVDSQKTNKQKTIIRKIDSSNNNIIVQEELLSEIVGGDYVKKNT